MRQSSHPPPAMLQAQAEHSQAELGCREALLFTASMSAVLFSVNRQAFSSIFRSLFSFNMIVYLANRHQSVLFAKLRKPRENTLWCWEAHRCRFCGSALEVNFPSSCSQHKGCAVPSTAGSVYSWMHSFALRTLQSCKGIPSQAGRACPGGGMALAKS